VKFFNAIKGYGFIQPDGGGRDLFVHADDVRKAGMTEAALAEGTRLNFDIVTDRLGKVRATGLRILSGAPVPGSQRRRSARPQA
jgi:cold shock protein